MLGESARPQLDLMDLLSAAWDGHLDESSRDRLEDLLWRENFAGMRVLIEFTRLHLDLELLVSSMAAHRRALDAIARAERAVPAPNWRARVKPGFGIAAAGILASLAVWLFFSWMGSGAQTETEFAGTPIVRPPLPVGRIVVGLDAEWRPGSPIRDGQSLDEGSVIELVRGSARISMDVGAEVLLKGPCRATLTQGNLVTLEEGAIAVKVAKWAIGFRVKTNDMLITDMGTRFFVQATAHGGSEVHVLEGRVVAKSLKQAASSRHIASSQAARINGRGDLEPIEFRHEKFADALEPLRPLRPILAANTGEGADEGAEDNGWIIRTGESQFGPYPQRATVCAATRTYGANDPARSQWISVNEGTTHGAPVRSKYTFETTFDLTGFDSSSVRLIGLVLADNGVEEVRLNGRPLPIAPWYDWYAGVTFFNFHTIEITNGFVPGKNVLSLVVVNETDIPDAAETVAPSDVPNPMALRVEWKGSGRPR